MKIASLIAVIIAMSVLAASEMLTPEPASGKDWNIYVVDGTGRAAWWTSLALDGSGSPRISYHDQNQGSLKYARWTGSDWSNETVDSVGLVGEYNSITLDSKGNPHIGYFDQTKGDLKYAKHVGGNWSIETVDSAGTVGRCSSIALDSGGKPHISYGGYGALKYARWTGSAWTIETIVSAETNGRCTSIALDSVDNPHISYFHSTYYHLRLKYARWNGSGWSTEYVAYAGFVAFVGGHTSMALDSNDNPHIAYYDWTDFKLKYARWTGSAWDLKSVDFVGFHDAVAGGCLSLDIDSSDKPHISYISNTGFDLKYAKWTGTAWNIESVDTAGGIGYDTSIAVDDDGNPHISYAEGIHYLLKYASTIELRPSLRPVLYYAPTSLDFGILNQGITSTDTFQIWNSGDGTLTYSLNESISWVTDVDPPNGSSTGEHDTINVTIDTTELSPGPYTGSIFITTNGGNGTVNVSVNVLAPSHSLSLDIDPDTLNLKSKGRWITAYLSAENASVYDIDISSILLQDTLTPERWDYQDHVLMLKFNRQEFKDTVQVGDSVEVKIAGKWEDGTEFEAYEYIGVIESRR